MGPGSSLLHVMEVGRWSEQWQGVELVYLSLLSLTSCVDLNHESNTWKVHAHCTVQIVQIHFIYTENWKTSYAQDPELSMQGLLTCTSHVLGLCRQTSVEDEACQCESPSLGFIIHTHQLSWEKRDVPSFPRWCYFGRHALMQFRGEILPWE